MYIFYIPWLRLHRYLFVLKDMSDPVPIQNPLFDNNNCIVLASVLSIW